MTDQTRDAMIQQRSFIVASNRGPITVQRNDQGEFEFTRGAGGLVTALSGLADKIDITWIACANTDDDKVWQEGKAPLAEKGAELYTKFISPHEDAYYGYYNVISNPLLWFLQHSMWDLPHAPIIDQNTWKAWNQGYVAVNQLFADTIIEMLSSSNKPGLVMLQDYHLYLAAKMIRQKLRPRQRPPIMHFTHIPWPGPEYWGALPPTMRQAILEGLCGADIVGFQTCEDGLNFIRTCETYLPRINVSYKRGRIWYRNHATHVRDFPISIDVQSLKELASTADVETYKTGLQDFIGDRKLILRVDRIEPSKNIVRGFSAYQEFLELYPEFLEKVVFLCLLVPSRLKVEEYGDYLDVLMASAGRINARFGTHQWEPIRMLVGENYARAVAAMQLYDVLLVNAIADGMNLVAKEGPIVNEKDGVLILSERAGARQQLESGSIIISPCDIYATAEAIHQALTAPPELRNERLERLRWLIEREDITDWLNKQLDAVIELGLLRGRDKKEWNWIDGNKQRMCD